MVTQQQVEEFLSGRTKAEIETIIDFAKDYMKRSGMQHMHFMDVAPMFRADSYIGADGHLINPYLKPVLSNNTVGVA